ncbi:MAG: hypothetical protein ACPGXK_06405 [Phycisphaerae bacterium]
MFSKKVVSLFSLGLFGIVLTGCMPDMTLEEMKTMMDEEMKRPSELDKLDMFVGNWSGDGEATFHMKESRTIKFTGNSSMKWGGDGWYLVDEFDGNMEIFGKHVGLNVWTYDPGSKSYRTTWFGNGGQSGSGVAKYDEEKNIWTMNGKTESSWGTMNGKGTMKFTDKDTMVWEWTEFGPFGSKVMEMKGTSHRK